MDGDNEKILQTKTLLIVEKMMHSCRLCLQKPKDESEIRSIFVNIGEDSPTYSDVAMSLARIEISNDDIYPKLLCNACAEKLQIFHEFKKKCELSDCTLKAVVTLGESIKRDLIQQPESEEYFDKMIINEEEVEEEKDEECTNADRELKYEDLDEFIEDSTDCFSISAVDATTIDLTDTYSLIEVADDCIEGCAEIVEEEEDCGEEEEEEEENETEDIFSPRLVNISKTILLSGEEELESYSKAKKRSKHNSGESKRFQCEECGRTYGRKSDLLQHSTFHTGIKRFRCDLCDSLFTRKSHLTAHMLIHNQLKPFTCDICGQSFRKLSNMSRHKLVHVNIYNFSCEMCGKLFKRAAAVKSHMRTHSGMRPYKCGGCNNAYTSYSGYKSHLKRHGCGTVRNFQIQIDDLTFVADDGNIGGVDDHVIESLTENE